MRNNKMTKNDIETLEFIKSYIETNKLPPTLEDIATHFNLSSRSVARHRVIRLRDQGLLSFSSQRRSITLTTYDYVLIPHDKDDKTSEIS